MDLFPADLAKALFAAQAEFKHAAKDADNPAFKDAKRNPIRYASLESVWDACVPALRQHGVMVIQPPVITEGGPVVRTLLIHVATGQTVHCDVPLQHASSNPMQGLGSAIRYGRRYGLAALVGVLDGHEDDGEAAGPPRASQRPTEAPQRRPPAKPNGNPPMPTKKAETAETWDEFAKLVCQGINGLWRKEGGTENLVNTYQLANHFAKAAIQAGHFSEATISRKDHDGYTRRDTPMAIEQLTAMYKLGNAAMREWFANEKKAYARELLAKARTAEANA